MSLEFSQQVDIANFGLQLLGVDAITTASFLSPDSVGAREMSQCYDKLRVAELRRNVWRHATRRSILRGIDTATVLWTPPAYSATATYSVGAITNYLGDYYQAQPGVLVGDIPDQAVTWLRYFGPITLDPFDISGNTNYFAGELVVMPEQWQVGNTYAAQTLIARTAAGVTLLYFSIAGGNVGNDPATDNGVHWGLFSVPTNQVPPAGPFVYTTFNGGPVIWMSMTTQTTNTPSSPPALPSAPNWLSQGGTFVTLQILYPIGTGPASDTTTNNVYRLPYGFLRQAPTNPKGGLTPPLGGPAYIQEEDYILEGNFIISSVIGPILFRFVADMIDVSSMDEMFCRGLGASMALQVCEKVTGSTEKRAEIRAEYLRVMGEARTVNGIEVGTVDPVEDEFIMVRL